MNNYKKKKIPFAEVDSKEKLGISVGINRPTASIAIIEAGESDVNSLE
jgi:ribosomal protein L7Ae-like RNA K-turn-binding protein